jgi:hypothetical protein
MEVALFTIWGRITVVVAAVLLLQQVRMVHQARVEEAGLHRQQAVATDLLGPPQHRHR